MKFLKHLFVFFSIAFLFGCAGQTTFKPTQKNQNYEKMLSNEIVVIFETSHLKKAFREAFYPTNSPIPELAASAVLRNITSELAKSKVGATTEIIDTSVDRSSFIKAIVKHRTKQQVLVLSANSFQTSQMTRYGSPIGPAVWSGRVTWNLRIFDADKAANPDGKAVWTATTDLVQFGPGQCNGDQYQTCSERFVAAIVTQLKNDGLIK